MVALEVAEVVALAVAEVEGLVDGEAEAELVGTLLETTKVCLLEFAKLYESPKQIVPLPYAYIW